MFFSSDPAVSSSIFVGAEREELIPPLLSFPPYSLNKGASNPGHRETVKVDIRVLFTLFTCFHCRAQQMNDSTKLGHC